MAVVLLGRAATARRHRHRRPYEMRSNGGWWRLGPAKELAKDTAEVSFSEADWVISASPCMTRHHQHTFPRALPPHSSNSSSMVIRLN